MQSDSPLMGPKSWLSVLSLSKIIRESDSDKIPAWLLIIIIADFLFRSIKHNSLRQILEEIDLQELKI